MQSISKNFIQLVLFLTFPILLNASEILHENNWTRIITGDKVVRLTRGISEQPQPTEIDKATVKTILNKMGYPEPTSSQLEAWLLGLKKHGWAQQENEPEHDSYHALQIIIVGLTRIMV